MKSVGGTVKMKNSVFSSALCHSTPICVGGASTTVSHWVCYSTPHTAAVDWLTSYSGCMLGAVAHPVGGDWGKSSSGINWW